MGKPPVTTVVYKTSLQCKKCVQKIQQIILETKGVQKHTIDRPKDLVTVFGTMDAKALAEVLKKNLNKPVEIVPPKRMNKPVEIVPPKRMNKPVEKKEKDAKALAEILKKNLNKPVEIVPPRRKKIVCEKKEKDGAKQMKIPSEMKISLKIYALNIEYKF